MPKIEERASFSSWAQFFSLEVNVRDANAIGRSEPSGKVCEITAPIP